MSQILTGSVYFIRMARSPFVKVGYTTVPVERRLATLQVSCPILLELEGAARGTEAAEERLHRHLRDRHERGEWFRLSRDEVRAILAQLVSGAWTKLADPGSAPGRLTHRQRRFVEAYHGRGTAVAAARAAGYSGSDATLAVTASRTLRSPRVRRALEARGVTLPPMGRADAA